MREQLVRVCATTEWREMFSYCQVTNIQASYSDHVSILITTQNTAQQERRKKKISRWFEEKWASHSSCETTIQEAWSTEVGRGSPMVVIFERIKKCRFASVD